jgi:antirestriction protein ArdC
LHPCSDVGSELCLASRQVKSTYTPVRGFNFVNSVRKPSVGLGSVQIPEAKAPGNKDQRDGLADQFLATTQADIREGHGEAHYVPSKDFISLPAFAAFKNADSFYGVAFHELGHWTGAKSRLDRSEGMKGRFGDRAYAAEELVAELCAAFLCAEFNMDGELRHAGYIATWIELLKADKKAFFTACSKAQAAADFLRSLALQQEVAA